MELVVPIFKFVRIGSDFLSQSLVFLSSFAEFWVRVAPKIMEKLIFLSTTHAYVSFVLDSKSFFPSPVDDDTATVAHICSISLLRCNYYDGYLACEQEDFCDRYIKLKGN